MRDDDQDERRRPQEYGLGVRNGWVITLLYGWAHYGKSLFWYTSEFLFAFFLTEVGAIPADRMGLILAAGLFVSAIIDMGVGSRLSRLLPTAASAGRLQCMGAVASAISMLLMFACTWLAGDARLAAALSMSLAFRLSYALYDIPQNSLLSLATSGERARTNLASMRYIFSGLASLTVAASLPPLLQADTLADRAMRFFLVALAFSSVAVASALLLGWALHSMRTAKRPTEGRTGPDGKLGGDIRLLIALMFVVSMAAPVFSKIEPYFAAFVLRDPLLGGGVAMAVSIGMTSAQPLWALLAQRVSRWAMIAVTAGAVVLAAIAFLFVSRSNGAALVAAALAFGAASGGIGMAMWATFSDAVARHAYGREGLAYGLFTASAKISLGMSGLAIGLLLTRIDYRGADSNMLVGMMVVPSILAGIGCAAVISWRQLFGGRPSTGSLPISGRRLL